MEQFYSRLKLGLKIVTGTQSVTSKWSFESAVDFTREILGIFWKSKSRYLHLREDLAAHNSLKYFFFMSIVHGLTLLTQMKLRVLRNQKSITQQNFIAPAEYKVWQREGYQLSKAIDKSLRPGNHLTAAKRAHRWAAAL
jgi:hypothetical protein